MSKLIDENGVATLIELVKKQTPNTYSKQEIDALVNQNRVSVDGSLSTSSPNPVSNRVVTSELSKKLNSTSVAQVALTGSYNDLKDKPALEEAVPLHIRSITQLDITNWNNKQDVISDLETIRSKANSAILTMPDWTKQSTKPTYTASEVGALPDSTEIPTKISDLTNDSSFLTEETDPVFNASPASEITSSDISNWNSKTDNVGTITGINMNGASKGTSGVVDLGTVLTEHLDLTNYVTTNTDLNVTGVKTFVGTKKVKFKQSTTNDKLGFTLLSSSSSSDNELGYLEYNPTGRRLTLGFYRPSTGAITPTSVGFTHTDLKNGASYYLFAPLSNNAKSKYNLNNTAKTFYLPLGITDGTNTVLTDNTGTIDISTLKPSDVYSKSEVDNEFVHANGPETFTGSWEVYPDIPTSAISNFFNRLSIYDAEDLADEDVYDAVTEITNLFPDGGTTPVMTIPYKMYRALTTVAFEFDEEYGNGAWEPSPNAVIRHSLEQLNSKANIDSPNFTGIPEAPTASNGTNTTQIATTEFVLLELQQINQILSVTNTPTSTGNSITITLSNGNTTTFNVNNGVDGINGADGVSLGEVALVQTTGNDVDKVMSLKAITDSILYNIDVLYGKGLNMGKSSLACFLLTPKATTMLNASTKMTILFCTRGTGGSSDYRYFGFGSVNLNANNQFDPDGAFIRWSYSRNCSAKGVSYTLNLYDSKWPCPDVWMIVWDREEGIVKFYDKKNLLNTLSGDSYKLNKFVNDSGIMGIDVGDNLARIYDIRIYDYDITSLLTYYSYYQEIEQLDGAGTLASFFIPNYKLSNADGSFISMTSTYASGTGWTIVNNGAIRTYSTNDSTSRLAAGYYIGPNDKAVRWETDIEVVSGVVTFSGAGQGGYIKIYNLNDEEVSLSNVGPGIYTLKGVYCSTGKWSVIRVSGDVVLKETERRYKFISCILHMKCDVLYNKKLYDDLTESFITFYTNKTLTTEYTDHFLVNTPQRVIITTSPLPLPHYVGEMGITSSKVYIGMSDYSWKQISNA